ncbi:SDR family oxidoreductase [Thermodesulfobacteriota bacterium]
MELGLKDKVVVVSAGSRGLGRASAMALAREGARVAIFSRDRGNLDIAAEAILTDTGIEILTGVADVIDHDGVDAFIDDVESRLGPPQILIVNAGGPPPGSFLDLTEKDWSAAFELTLMSAVHLCHRVIPSMTGLGWGRILHLTSISVKQPLPNMILSNSLRAAVTGLAKSLADELGPSNITVNCICTGLTMTERLMELARARLEQEGASMDDTMASWLTQIPSGRLGTVEEFGSLVAFLCSEQAGYINGASIPFDGGMYRGLL